MNQNEFIVESTPRTTEKLHVRLGLIIRQEAEKPTLPQAEKNISGNTYLKFGIAGTLTNPAVVEGP